VVVTEREKPCESPGHVTDIDPNVSASGSRSVPTQIY
jgi:hypothetical protein